jgi:hypothetical protein
MCVRKIYICPESNHCTIIVTVVLITVAKLFPQWRWGGKNGLLGSGGNPTYVPACFSNYSKNLTHRESCSLDVLARDSLVYFVLIFGESAVPAATSNS